MYKCLFVEIRDFNSESNYAVFGVSSFRLGTFGLVVETMKRYLIVVTPPTYSC